MKRSAIPALLLALASCSTSRSLPLPLGALEARWQSLRYWDDQARLLRSRGADSTTCGLSRSEAAESLKAARAVVAAMLRSDTLRPSRSEPDSPLIAIRSAWHEGLSGDSSRTAGPGSPLAVLTDSVIAEYGHQANTIVVDGDTLNRLAVLGLLSTTEDASRRERLFLALAPIWRSVNGEDEADSPYRRLLQLRRQAWSGSRSPVDSKGPGFGLTTAGVERWLVAALERWRTAAPDSLLEPWDWYYMTGLANRRLSPRIPAIADLRRVNEAFYLSIGASPSRLHIHYDLEARPDKDPVAFTDFGIRNRWLDGRLTPGEPWVFTNYLAGGLDNLAELLHESGHAIHLAAISTRPAYLDWPDNDTFTEALADLPAMELYEPSWQMRFLGDSVPLAASLRLKYAGITMDLAWALFEIRVHHDPSADPNLIWTSITRDYLRIRPHPEWSWWAMRGQLVDSPGYLINYALGAFLVADMRAAIRRKRGAVAWREPGMYRWLSAELYRYGLERPSRQVLESLLGRGLRPEALLDDLARMQR